MTRLYTRRERLDFIAMMLVPAMYVLLAGSVALAVASWVTR